MVSFQGNRLIESPFNFQTQLLCTTNLPATKKKATKAGTTMTYLLSRQWMLANIMEEATVRERRDINRKRRDIEGVGAKIQ